MFVAALTPSSIWESVPGGNGLVFVLWSYPGLLLNQSYNGPINRAKDLLAVVIAAEGKFFICDHQINAARLSRYGRWIDKHFNGGELGQ